MMVVQGAVDHGNPGVLMRNGQHGAPISGGLLAPLLRAPPVAARQPPDPPAVRSMLPLALAFD